MWPSRRVSFQCIGSFPFLSVFLLSLVFFPFVWLLRHYAPSSHFLSPIHSLTYAPTSISSSLLSSRLRCSCPVVFNTLTIYFMQTRSLAACPRHELSERPLHRRRARRQGSEPAHDAESAVARTCSFFLSTLASSALHFVLLPSGFVRLWLGCSFSGTPFVSSLFFVFRFSSSFTLVSSVAFTIPSSSRRGFLFLSTLSLTPDFLSVVFVPSLRTTASYDPTLPEPQTTHHIYLILPYTPPPTIASHHCFLFRIVFTSDFAYLALHVTTHARLSSRSSCRCDPRVLCISFCILLLPFNTFLRTLHFTPSFFPRSRS